MKVTISFNSTKIVVPCGDGDISVREATNLAITRYRKAIGKPESFWVSVSSLKSHEGGMLDPDDLLCDVCDDREQLMAIFDEQPFSGHVGDGMSSSDSTSDKDPIESAISSGKSSQQPSSQVRRVSEPSLKKGSGTGLASGSVQAVVASINALHSNQKHLNFINQRSKTSHDEQWSTLCNPRKSYLNDSNHLRSSLRNAMSVRSSSKTKGDDETINIIHTNSKQDSYSDREDNFDSLPNDAKGSLHVLRRREPLGASANKPDKSPKKEIVPILKNSKSAVNIAAAAQITSSTNRQEPSFEIVIQNEIGPLGIHVVPCDEDGRLVVQGIEPGGRVDRDGRLAIGDEIIRINSYPLEDTSFNEAQEIFKEALFAKELRLRVVKGFGRRGLAQRVDGGPDLVGGSTDFAAVAHPGFSKAHTLPRAEKLAAGTKITTAVHANNTRKIGTVIPISLKKGASGLGFSITTRDNALGGNTPVYIKNILPKGAAIEEGTLKPGDRLLEVNQVCVDGMSQSDVVSLLRNAPLDCVLNLVVSRHITTTGQQSDDPKPGAKQKQIQFNVVEDNSEENGIDRSQTNTKEVASKELVSLPSSASPIVTSDNNYEDLPLSEDFQYPWKQRQILTFDIPVHDSERAGLGVSVKGKTCNGKDGVVDLGIFVKSVLHGGAASRDGRLKMNDQLVNINGMSLLGKANPEAMETLRKAMHDEGPIPGVISLTVARRHHQIAHKLKNEERRSSVSSFVTSSDEDVIREYNVMNSQPLFKMPPPTSSSSQLSSLIGTRNPVIDRLMGKESASAGVLPSNLRNESYYMATHDTWNGTMIQNHLAAVPQPKVVPNDHQLMMVEQDEKSVRSSTNTLNQGSEEAEGTRESLTSLVEVKPFARDQPGRQSMSEKRHATLDAKNTDTYQKRKKAREGRERQQQQQQNQWSSFKKSASLESLHLQSNTDELESESTREALRAAYVRASSVRVTRSRGCNESFRTAVDRSYEKDLPENEEPVGENSGFVIEEDPDFAVTANDENVNKSNNGNQVVLRRNKGGNEAKENKKTNRNSRLLTGLSNMFKSSGSSKKSSQFNSDQVGSDSMRVKSSNGRKVPSASTVFPPPLLTSGPEGDSQPQQQVRQQWYNHHMQLHQSKLQQQQHMRSHSQPRPRTDAPYDQLASSIMRPGSRVGIADLASSSDYDVLHRLKHQQRPPPPPPVHPYHHQMHVYQQHANGYPPPPRPFHHGLPLLPHSEAAPSSGRQHVRSSSNLPSVSSLTAADKQPSISASSLPCKPHRHRPKSNYYEYELQHKTSSGYSPGSDEAPAAAHVNHQRMIDRSKQQQQQIYSMSMAHHPLQQQHYFHQPSDFN